MLIRGGKFPPLISIIPRCRRVRIVNPNPTMSILKRFQPHVHPFLIHLTPQWVGLDGGILTPGVYAALLTSTTPRKTTQDLEHKNTTENHQLR